MFRFGIGLTPPERILNHIADAYDDANGLGPDFIEPEHPGIRPSSTPPSAPPTGPPTVAPPPNVGSSGTGGTGSGGPRYVPSGPDGKGLPSPKDSNGQLIPSSSHPHTQIGWRKGRRGEYVQTREFGPDGKPVKRIDWTDHGRPDKHTNPHAHDLYQIRPAEPIKSGIRDHYVLRSYDAPA